MYAIGTDETIHSQLHTESHLGTLSLQPHYLPSKRKYLIWQYTKNNQSVQMNDQGYK